MIRKQSVVLTALAFFAVSPAYALDFDALLNTVLGNSNTFNLSSQDNLKVTINERQAQLEQQLEAGAASGYLTSQEQQEVRNQLNHVAFLEGSYLSDGNLSRSEVKTLVDELSHISRRLEAYLANADMTNKGDGRYDRGRWNRDMARWRGRGQDNDGVQNQLRVKALIDTKQAQLDAAISSGLRNGTLRTRDAQSLRATLNRIAADESTMLADGKLTYLEEKQLTDALASLETRIQSSTIARGRHGRGRVDRTDVASYRAHLKARIERGLQSGKLSRVEAQKLYNLEKEVAKLEAVYKNNNWGGPLHAGQQKALLSKLDELDNRLNRELNDRDIW